MTGRPGHRTMEMNGRSTVSYLARTPRAPFSMLFLKALEAKGLLAFQGRRGIASLYGGTSVRSYAVSNKAKSRATGSSIVGLT